MKSNPGRALSLQKKRGLNTGHWICLTPQRFVVKRGPFPLFPRSEFLRVAIQAREDRSLSCANRRVCAEDSA